MLEQRDSPQTADGDGLAAALLACYEILLAAASRRAAGVEGETGPIPAGVEGETGPSVDGAAGG